VNLQVSSELRHYDRYLGLRHCFQSLQKREFWSESYAMYQEIILYKVLWTISNFNIAKFGMRVPRLLYPWRREKFLQDKISRVHIDQQTEFKALVSLVLGWGHDPRSLWTPEGDQILSIARPVYMYQIKAPIGS